MFESKLVEWKIHEKNNCLNAIIETKPIDNTYLLLINL